MIRLLLALLALVTAGTARADTLRPGYLDLVETAPGHWQVLWKAPILGGLASRARPALPGFCTLRWEPPRLSGDELVEAGTAVCSKPLAGSTVGLSGMAQGFTDALLRVSPKGGAVTAERLTPDRPMAEIPLVAGRGEVLRTYLGLGIGHILTGWDHLLFVVSLVLLIRRGWMVAKTVTAFTLAHSLTLAPTALGLFVVARRPVEICIALSIVFLAVEIVKADPGPAFSSQVVSPDDSENESIRHRPRLTERMPWLVAFAFGLLHGLGFAAALAEIGLPQGEVPAALFAFNVGVEIGQLAIVMTALALLWLIARFAARRAELARRFAAYAIGTTAAFWMIQRALG